MSVMKAYLRHRKLIKHYENLGHVRELPFSCYRRMPLLTNDLWREMLSQSIDAAAARHNWRLTAFVYMPEHVHLLFFPGNALSAATPLTPKTELGATAGSSSSVNFEAVSTIDHLLRAIKRPYSYRIKQRLVENRSSLLDRLTIRQRPGITTFRYWQEGPGYDRNLESAAAILAAIDYIHLNPVRRGLCKTALDWKCSSVRFYVDPAGPADPALPKLYSLPAEFLR